MLRRKSQSVSRQPMWVSCARRCLVCSSRRPEQRRSMQARHLFSIGPSYPFSFVLHASRRPASNCLAVLAASLELNPPPAQVKQSGCPRTVIEAFRLAGGEIASSSRLAAFRHGGTIRASPCPPPAHLRDVHLCTVGISESWEPYIFFV